MGNTKDGCSSMSGGYELVSLGSESGKHLLSVVLSNYNHIIISNSSFLLFINFIFNTDFYSYFVKTFESFHYFILYIYIQFSSSDLKCKCECTCSCNSKCTGNFICLCLCECTKGQMNNSCCICLCKKQEQNGNSKCVCICICKKGEKCCCETGTQHNCESCLIKIDMGTLIDKSLNILNNLKWIRCFISRIENKSGSYGCCSCSCRVKECRQVKCQSHCCCKQGPINYSSVISKISIVVMLLKEAGTKILELTKMNKTLTFYSNKITSERCKICNCKQKIKDLTENIQKSGQYYSSFASIIGGIKSFVEYKMNYNKSKQIISSLEKSINPLLKQLRQMNNYIIKAPNHNMSTNNTSVVQMNKLLMGIYSQYNVLESYLVINRLVQCEKKIDQILQLVSWPDSCECILRFETNNNKIILRDIYFTIIIYNLTSMSRDEFVQFLGLDKIRQIHELGISDNHKCLCMVFKYILYPSIIKLFYLLEVDLDALNTISRKHHKQHNWTNFNQNVPHVLLLAIDILESISNWVRNKYHYATTAHRNEVEIKCFCMYSDDLYYPYLISIILFVSSLIENIWTMDPKTMKLSINCLSTLYSQLEIYDLNSTSLKRVCCNPVYWLLVNKECQPAADKQKCCCCWCVTCYNLGIILIYLCLQFKLHKAIGGTKNCEDWKKFCEVDDSTCTCTDKQNGVCCLLKLAACSQASSSTREGCKSLDELLKECCKECTEGDCCCKKLLAKVTSGLCKVLLLGCRCECTTTTGTSQEVKGKIVFFKDLSERTRVAVVVFCKYKTDAKPCCCLYQLIEKLNSQLSPKLKNICNDGQCVCDELKNVCNEICKGDCCDQAKCPCKELKDKLDSICKVKCNGEGGNGECLCKQITSKIGNCLTKCAQGKCECSTKEGLCRCVCCKVVAYTIKILSRACRQNVLDPYKRITIELLSSSERKRRRVRTILVNVNKSMVKKISLIEISSSSNPNLNSKNSIESRNWEYDTHFEHQVTTLCNHILSPKLITVNHGTIYPIQNIDTHLAVVPT